jgi:hypothetical protein
LETNRFPAISGLAQAFQNRGLGRYVAGLWTEDLPLWLIWCRHTGFVSKRRTDIYVAPSWSWASLAGGTPVYFNYFALIYYQPSGNHLKILDVACEPVGPDLTGAIRSGYLIIRGRAVPADLWSVNSSGMENDCRVQRGGWEAEVTLDMIRHHPESNDVLCPQEVNCLLVCSVTYSTFILILTAGDRPREYKRCGLGASTNSVRFTEDCERSTKYRPGLKISEEEDLKENVRNCPVIDAWFKDIEEQEMTLV